MIALPGGRWRIVVRLVLALLLVAMAGAPVAAQTRAPVTRPEVGTESPEADSINRADIARGLRHLQELEGKPIRAISVETAGTKWKDEITPTSVEVGTPLNGSIGRKVIEEMLDTGRFAQAYADARPFEDGVILRVVVLPRRIIAGIRLLGGRGDTRRMLQNARLVEGGEITEPGLRRAVVDIKAFYLRAGYDQAEVEVDTKVTDDPMEILLNITITPGRRQLIARRIFVIEPKLDEQVGDLKYGYWVGRGDVADEERLIEADNSMADSLRAAGFLEAAVKHRILRKGNDAFLYVYLQTGPRHRFYFQGNVRQDDDDLRSALGLGSPSGDTSPAALREKLLTYYRNRGLLDVRVDTEVRLIEDGAVRELRFTIVEGATVKVAQRIFPCLPDDVPDDLTAAEMDDEIDGVLTDILPDMPLFHEIDGGTVDVTFGQGGGKRAVARRLRPEKTYTDAAYDRAVKHLEELLASRGYLNASVGPLSVIRAECDPTARGGVCVPFVLPDLPKPRCRKNQLGLPVDEKALPEAFTCKPDPSRSITCSPTMAIYLPIQLGPQTRLYDIVFEGNEVLSSNDLRDVAAFELGAPFSNLELDAAQARVLNAYKDEGYYYATVGTAVDYSPDRTRARARFIINEQKPVVIEEYEIRGAYRTYEGLILSRLALCIDLERCTEDERRFRRNLVRKSEEQIATLGTFSSVSIVLEDPDIPKERKRVIITVSELKSQYVEPSGGFYTGDGIRVGAEYGHRNIGGQAISLTLRLEFAFLPDFLIFNDAVRENYSDLSLSDRIERRNTGTLRFPDVGLGPQVDFVINAVDARDNQRDFGLTREAILPTLNWRPFRTVTLQLGISAELNDVQLFNADSIADAIRQELEQGGSRNLANLLRVPDGRTIAIAQRVSANWDRRDKPLSATRGTLINASVEHVSAFPFDDDPTDDGDGINSEFLRFNSQVAGYIPLGNDGWAIALSVAAGYNLQLTSTSDTYPDRLFYLGGVSNLRGFQVDSVVPQDVAEEVVTNTDLDINDVGIRGGNLFLNPRLELRIPITSLLSAGIFLDTGNVWSDPEVIKSIEDLLTFRYTAGLGARFNTPIGPIAFDVGFPLRRFEWEDVAAVHLGIGLF